jgi:hypothetical protein
MITNLILIQLIVVIIIDISGIVQSVENAIARALKLKSVSIHLIECSFCINHWVGLLYLLLTGSLSLETYCFVLILCFLTSVTKELLWTVRDFFIYLIRLVNRLF